MTKNIVPLLNYEKENIYELTDLIDLQSSFLKSYLKRN
jgi:hypothetical protein